MTSNIALFVVALFFPLVTLWDGLNGGFSLWSPKYPVFFTLSIVAIIKSRVVLSPTLPIVSGVLFEFIHAFFTS